jgi:hypothetical protein
MFKIPVLEAAALHGCDKQTNEIVYYRITETDVRERSPSPGISRVLGLVCSVASFVIA